MEVKILSRETIKPSYSCIPHDHPKTFQLSLLDKLSPLHYTPIIFFYSINEADGRFKTEDLIADLKLSLSETLARFYPLAGRSNGEFIRCSDDGALFVKAKVVNLSMAEFLKKPNLQLLPHFIPLPYLLNESLNGTVQIAVQINSFESGGIAMGMSLLHSIIDGTAMSSFIKSWAASTQKTGSEEKVVCDYNLSIPSILFPQREISSRHILFSQESPFFIPEGERRSRIGRFVFDGMAISNLKAKAKSVSVPNPTSVEVVTCFIWKYTMKAARAKLAEKKDVIMSSRKSPSVITHAVNMRRRIEPPLPEETIGNMIWRTNCYYEYEASNAEATKLDDLEKLLRQSISKINNDFVRKISGENGFENITSSLNLLDENYEKAYDSYFFASWRNMGLKDVDFGWGKPAWISAGRIGFESTLTNVFTLIETLGSGSGSGDGIEAWAILDEEVMESLEHDTDFLQFASLNPSISLP